ncbi:hemerythrin domain-containing protein [Maricaulis sp.]|uniref:hemerythrin domain-containing protein n=1 Tax=Maricaulis sp. TaxID=1486257 RepID=UPI003A914BDB
MTQDLPPDDPAELTRFIETRYHAIHRAQLPDLTAMALRVERVHADAAKTPHGLADLLQELIGALEVHMKKEELILFPAIRRGGASGLENPIAVMRTDHEDHKAEVAKILTLTDNLTLPDGACRTWTALYDGLEIFIRDLDAHLQLENEVLFPQFEPEQV